MSGGEVSIAVSVRGRARVRSIKTSFVRIYKPRIFVPSRIVVSISGSNGRFARLGHVRRGMIGSSGIAFVGFN